MKKVNQISRRSFIAGSAALAGGLAVSGFASQSFAAAKEENWDIEADVIVVGSGMAGCLASLSVLDNGGSVIMLEKMSVLGGNSAMTTSMGIPNSYVQKALGIQDDPELLIKDINAVGMGLNHPELTRIVAYESSKSLDLAVKYGTPYGLELDDKVYLTGGHSVTRSVRGKGGNLGAKFVTPMHKAIEAHPKGEIYTTCKVDKILKDSTGKVIGVAARTGYVFDNNLRSDDLENKGGNPVRIKANKSVIVASGGFGRDVEFMIIEQPQLEIPIQLAAKSGCTGGMIRAMMAIGARSCHVGVRRLSLGLSLPDFKWGCLIDPMTGKRFVDEGLHRDGLGTAILTVLQNNGGTDPLAIYSELGATHIDTPTRITNGLKDGSIKKYANIEEFAQDKKIDVKTLTETMTNYDSMVDSGIDTEFGKAMTNLKDSRLGAGPYYVVRFRPLPGQSPGGIYINTKAQVVRAKDGKAIPGLFAAGEVTGGVHGGDQLGAASTPDCLAFGRIAGEEALKS